MGEVKYPDPVACFFWVKNGFVVTHRVGGNVEKGTSNRRNGTRVGGTLYGGLSKRRFFFSKRRCVALSKRVLLFEHLFLNKKVSRALFSLPTRI